MKNILLLIGLVCTVMITSCGNQVVLNYNELEAQYIELEPYWKMCFDDNVKKDSSAAIGFSKNYKIAREIINYYNKAGRDIGPAGTHEGAASDTELLWKLRMYLNYASGYTNKIIINPE